jgi:ribonuclease T2
MFSRILKLCLFSLLMQGAADVALARHHHRDADGTPGEFDYYLLSLSWSPAFCIQQPDSPECSGPRRFGFIVHGLWPQNERGWPQHCGDSELPDAVASGVADLMPARKLVYHEWSTHGTCSGLDPQAYFDLVRKARSFMHANPRFPADSVVVTCSQQGAPRLREVHVCFDRELHPRACSADSLKEGCRADSVIVPPVR